MARGLLPDGDSGTTLAHSATSSSATASCGSQLQSRNGVQSTIRMPTRIAAPPSIEETRAAAQVLFTQFCRDHLPPGAELSVDPDQLEQEEEIPDEIAQSMRRSAQLDGYGSAYMATFGRDLRRIADQMEESRERRNIRIEASKVDLQHVGYHSFRKMLSELFEGGNITRERIIVLFFFCSDVAARTLDVEFGGLSCSQLFTWSMAFILDVICNWVQIHGGWGVVLSDLLPRFAVNAFAVFGLGCLALFIKQRFWP